MENARIPPDLLEVGLNPGVFLRKQRGATDSREELENDPLRLRQVPPGRRLKARDGLSQDHAHHQRFEEEDDESDSILERHESSALGERAPDLENAVVFGRVDGHEARNLSPGHGKAIAGVVSPTHQEFLNRFSFLKRHPAMRHHRSAGDADGLSHHFQGDTHFLGKTLARELNRHAGIRGSGERLLEAGEGSLEIAERQILLRIETLLQKRILRQVVDVEILRGHRDRLSSKIRELRNG